TMAGRANIADEPTSRTEEDLQYILSGQPTRFRDADIALIRRAYEVAERAHAGQMRKSGDRYIRHPVEVARILSDLRFDSHTIAAGLLHDTLEDTKCTYESLLGDFPRSVVDLVEGVTKISSLNFRTNREQQVASLPSVRLQFP
ncbi:MAG: HD domain-containing protein, partial [Chloroflexi bacterium]|nr:HD domain-containing protein [Chloroflexota bacterium]